MTRHITLDFEEDVVDHKPYLTSFSWTSPDAIMHFRCLTPATPDARLKSGIMFSPRTVLRTFVDEVEELGDAVLFVSSERWEVVSSYLRAFGLRIPENTVYRVNV